MMNLTGMVYLMTNSYLGFQWEITKHELKRRVKAKLASQKASLANSAINRWNRSVYNAANILTFKSSPALEQFMFSDHKRMLVRAANRVGKSNHAAVKLVRTMLTKPGRYRAVGVTNGQATKVISKYLYELIPKDQLVNSYYTKAKGWRHNLIQLKNGSICQIMSYEQDALKHAGDTLDGVWLDEPPPMDIFSESLARVFDTNGFVWITMTPIGRTVEWLKKLIEDQESGWLEYVAELSVENCPWYTVEQVEKWYREAACQMNSYRQRIFGDWEGQPTEVRFNQYDQARHTISLQALEELSYNKYIIGIDHGEKASRQTAILIALMANGTIVCLDEYSSSTASTPKMDAVGIFKMLRKNGLEPEDISTWTGDVNTGGKMAPTKTVNQLLEAEILELTGQSIKIIKPYKSAGSVDKGEYLINQALSENMLLFHTDCIKLRSSMLTYNGEENLKHPIDALRYALYPILENVFSDDKPTVTRIKQR